MGEFHKIAVAIYIARKRRLRSNAPSQKELRRIKLISASSKNSELGDLLLDSALCLKQKTRGILLIFHQNLVGFDHPQRNDKAALSQSPYPDQIFIPL